jgi:L-lysine 6-transaminase
MKPEDVRSEIGTVMLADGQQIIPDLTRSHDSYLVDARTGREYLDFFTYFATQPVAYNHPRLREPDFVQKMGEVALHNPSNSDFYTVEMAQFVKKFSETAMPEDMPHLFLIAGGTLAVENALKVAFDWKVRKNLARGKGEKGHRVIHFHKAFHGRSGYTLSLTNTADPRKHKYFAKFDWPRVSSPILRFPITDAVLADVKKLEAQAVAEIEQAVAAYPDDIAALIIEPIQGEGGDNHFRPEFFAELRRLADEHEFMLIVDEVQSGMGTTGKWWAVEHMGVKPDIIAFGKKAQVCGIIAGPRVDEVEENVFNTSSRLNSTWGGSLTDMVRATRYLEIYEEENLIENAAEVGEMLLSGLRQIASESNGLMDNVRGRGMFIAFDLPSTEERDRMQAALRDEVALLALKSGTHAIRFRPMLDLPAEVAEEALDRVNRAVNLM